MKHVDTIYELLDNATMIYYSELKFNYLDAMIQLSKDLIESDYPSRLSEEATIKLDEIYASLRRISASNEEIRLAWELLIAKGFKHTGYRLNLMTPDSVNYLISHIVTKKFAPKRLTVLDTALGTANLLQAVSNRYPNDLRLIGIEDDEKLVRLSKASSDLQGNIIDIYCQDATQPILDYADLIIGDLDAYQIDAKTHPLFEDGVLYFPYLVITRRLENLKDDGYFIYIIENDFFSQEKAHIFRNALSKQATLLALIVLPESMFQKDYIGKSILIGKKKVLNSYDMIILDIPSLEENELKKTIVKLNEMIGHI